MISVERPKQFSKWLALPILAWAACTLAAETGEWTLRRHDVEHDITVHDRALPAGYREFRGVTHIKSRLSAFVALFRDTANMPDWLYRTELVAALEEPSATETYAYTVIGMPWPFRDRDSIVHVMLTQDAASQVITLRASAKPDFRPRVEGYVRMPMIESSWRFTPLPDGRTEVQFTGYADPGGKLSSGLLRIFQNKLVWQSPLHTLRNMQALIGRAEYQAAQYPHIEEPRIWSAARSPAASFD